MRQVESSSLTSSLTAGVQRGLLVAATAMVLIAPILAGDPGVAPLVPPLIEAKKVLTLAGAKSVAAAAVAEARKNQAGGAIAVVDDGGNLLYLERLDGTFAAASNIAIGKARSAANFRRDTRVFEDAIRNGRTSLIANPELLPLEGGVAILVDGQVVGGIGVAGANSAQQDEDIARLAASTLGASTAVAKGGGR